jgi:ubiquinone/menaquinone biosynthesis C-methylase UbiE
MTIPAADEFQVAGSRFKVRARGAQRKTRNTEREPAPGQGEIAAFNALERRAWEDAALAYVHAWGRLTCQAIEPLLDAVRAGPGIRLLDVASGPGGLAAAAALRRAQVVGLDASSAMLIEARRQHPTIQFLQGDAQDLPMQNESFDAVAMNFGLLHLGRPEDAFAEARRVLKAGGWLGSTVWAPPEETAAFRLVLDAIRAHGRPDVGLPAGPPFFRFADAAEACRTLERLGFEAVTVKQAPLVWRFASPEILFEAMYRGTARTRALLRSQTEEALANIRESVTEGAGAYRTPGGSVELPMPAVLTSARKPFSVTIAS